MPGNKPVARHSPQPDVSARQEIKNSPESQRFEIAHQAALASHQQGNFADALRHMAVALSLRPFDAAALSNFGAICSALGKDQEALASYDKAVALKPDHADALVNRGNTLSRLSRHEEALASYDRALLYKASSCEALIGRAEALVTLGGFEEALASCRRAINIDPHFGPGHGALGNVLRKVKRRQEAVASFQVAISLTPTDFLAHHSLGVTLLELNRPLDALHSLDQAISLNPRIAEAHSNRANALRSLNRSDEAILSCQRALALRPTFVDAWMLHGGILADLGRLGDALNNYEFALRLAPNNIGALVKRGAVLLKLNQDAYALASFEQALLLQPDRAEAHCGRGNALMQLGRFAEAAESYGALCVLDPRPYALAARGNALVKVHRFDEALTCFDQAIAFDESSADAHHSLSLCLLLLGELDRGWREFEWRWEMKHMQIDRRTFTKPQWSADHSLNDQTVLLCCEQGFGDTIQYARYASLLAERGARVILEVQRPLESLLQSVAGVAQVVARGEALPNFDFYCPLASLPFVFGASLPEIPAKTPYLHPPPEIVAKWSSILGPKTRPRIGVVWSGNPYHTNDRNRSIPLSDLIPAPVDDVEYISLQREVREIDWNMLCESSYIRHFGPSLSDYSETAGLICNLDLVISVDTSVAHLAGALGKPVWILLPFAPDYRWRLNSESSEWYPTARLFRQDESMAWRPVIARVSEAIREFASG
jgi:tetratricopeptide (TPR) repeat protein